MNKQKLKILHLEDTPSDAEIVARELKKGDFQYELVWVTNKADFEKGLNEFLPDIILSDHSLPSFTSTDALEIVKEKNIDIPFILVTSTVSDDFAVSMIKQGASDYILKDRMQRLPSAIQSAREKWLAKQERQQFLDTIIQSEKLLRDAEKLAHIGSWKADLETGKTHWSDEEFRIYGYTTNEIIPSFDLVLSHIHPKDFVDATKAIEGTIKSDNSLTHEFRIIDKNGKVKYLHSELVVDRNKDGKPVVLRGFNQDITDIRKAEIKIRTSEERYRQIVETAQEGIWMVDENYKTVFVNKKMCEILQYSAEEMAGKETAYFMDEEGKKAAKDSRKRREEGISEDYEITFLTKKGKRIWAHMSESPILNKNGTFTGALAMVTDITERKRDAEALQKSEANLLAIIENTNAYVYSLDTNFRYLTYNTLLKNRVDGIFGLDIQPGTSAVDFYDKFDPEEKKEWISIYSKALTGETIQLIKEYNVDEKQTFISFSITPIIENNNVIGLSCFSRDITQQKLSEMAIEKQNKELIKTNAELDRFVYSASHELRAPLSSTLGLINVARLKEEDPEKLKILGMMQSSIDRLDNFIKDIIYHSRNSRLEVECEKIDFKEVFDESIEQLNYMEGADKIKITIAIEGKEVFCSDKKRISVLFNNFLSNAIKYHDLTHADPYVKVMVKLNPDSADLQIRDNGTGIPKEYLDKIFNMFYRATEEKTGSGLGLYITKEIVDKMGGSIRVESEKGVGTTFFVTIPNIKE